MLKSPIQMAVTRLQFLTAILSQIAKGSLTATETSFWEVKCDTVNRSRRSLLDLSVPINQKRFTY